MLDHVLSFKGEPVKVKYEIVDFNINLIANNGSGFDSYIVLNNLPQWRSIINLNKNEAGIVSLTKFNGYVIEKRKILNMYILDVGEFILLVVWKKIGVSFKLQLSFLKQEIENDEIYENTWETKEDE